MSADVRLVDYLEHIRDAIEAIDVFTDDMSEVQFLGNDLVSSAVIRKFEIIGEAANKIYEKYRPFVDSHPEMDLSNAYRLRNRVAHGYFKVDLSVIWKTAQVDLPILHGQVKLALEKLQSGE